MNLFRVRGIQVAVHFSFFILLAYVGWEGAQPHPDPYHPGAMIGGGWFGVFANILTVVAFFTCVLLHEFGHSFTAIHFGVGVRRILLMPIGGMAEFTSIPRQPSRELLITLAGPAVNSALAAAMSLAVGLPTQWPLQGDYAADLVGFVQLLRDWNIAMGAFNLAPVFPMDGGRILRALLAIRLPYLRATWVAAAIGKILATVAAVVAVFYFDSPLTAVLFAFIFFAGEMEYRAIKRREIEDARWRAELARFYSGPSSSAEPPLLSRP